MTVTASTGVNVGDVLAGKYRVDRVIGAGGMGVVVAAHHVQLDEKVAIKFLLPEMLGHGESVSRFAREARAAVKIKNEHVARVFDVGTLDNGAPYMVMEYLEGGDLAAWVQQRGPLPVEQAVDFVLQACEALADAHALGIVHRDLKPANLFCLRQSDGTLFIKVLDFGISKMTGALAAGSSPGSDVAMTRTNAVMGSPLYMSPEQMQSAREVDARADIWALGVVLFELVTGRAPFSGQTYPEVCVKIATEAPPPLRSLRPDAPLVLEQVVVRCLQKDRAHRYPNVAELAFALLDLAPRRSRASVEKITKIISNAGLSSTALALPPSSDATSDPPGAAPASGTMDPWGGTRPPSPAPRWGRVVAGGAAVCAVAIGAAVLGVKPPHDVGGATGANGAPGGSGTTGATTAGMFAAPSSTIPAPLGSAPTPTLPGVAASSGSAFPAATPVSAVAPSSVSNVAPSSVAPAGTRPVAHPAATSGTPRPPRGGSTGAVSTVAPLPSSSASLIDGRH